MNSDTKVISKILVSRIKNHLTNIIDDVQFAYVKEKYIGEPVHIIADILEYTVAQNLPGILFGADYEAAFDSIDHNFIFATLKRFGFKEDFIRWVQILHLNAESCIINNGFFSNYIRLARGTRQGDPLASYLFILVMQIFSSIIKFDKEIKGISVGNTEIKMVLFADDSTFFLHNWESLERLERHLSVISLYTSLAVNYTIKSKLAWIGKDRFRRDTQGPYEWIDLNKSSIKILGIHFTYDKVLSNNFDQVFFKVKNTLNLWKSRWLTIYGKVTVIPTVVLSLILYVCNMQSPPSCFMEIYS